MTVEAHYLSRAEPPQTFLAPCNSLEAGWTCSVCGLPIEPRQETVDWREKEHAHADCAVQQAERED